VLAVVSGQLLFPYDTAVPFARIAGANVGMKTRNQLAGEFQNRFEQSVVTISNGERTATRKLPLLGVVVNNDRMSEKLTRYPLWERLVPFSLFVKWPEVRSLDVTLTGDKVEVATAAIAKELSYEPADAGLALKNNQLEVTSAKDGKQVSEHAVRDALLQASYSAGTTKLTVGAKTISPKRSNADVAVAKKQAEGALSRELTLRVKDKGEYKPDAVTRATWFSIVLDTTPASLAVNRTAVESYVNVINTKVAEPPTNSTVKYVDGIEVGRTQGAEGRALNVSEVTDTLAATLLDANRSAVVAADRIPVSSPVIVERTYSHTQTGLRAYVAHTTNTQNVRIVVQQLNGEGWSASGRADESIPSASTYKLFVAKMLFKRMEEGAVHWDDPLLDTTVSGCFDRMTIASTNPCAIEWLKQFGRDTMNNYVYSLGFSTGTSFTHPEAVHTTASDLAKFMVGLENGSLVGGAYRDRLYHSLGTHPYRYGIPTGVKGQVYDKVGFLWDYVHDSAIVYGPKGTYVLVIMTKGYSYAYIANVARQIEAIMYP